MQFSVEVDLVNQNVGIHTRAWMPAALSITLCSLDGIVKADVFPTKRVLSSGAETCGGPHGLEELGALMTSEKTKRFLAAI